MEDPACVAVMSDAPGELLAVVAQLRAEVAQLRQEVGRLQRENLELRQQAGYWQRMHARAAERVKQLEHRVEELEAENRQLRQQAFGRKTEKAGSLPRKGSFTNGMNLSRISFAQ